MRWISRSRTGRTDYPPVPATLEAQIATYPGSRLLFPTLCKPTAPVSTPENVPSAEPNRGLMMPRRKHTREYNRQRSIEAERKLNDNVAERNKPPPF